jgi:succinate dehydrogenase / fumarate reductase, cytochrome b subunit
VTTSRRDLRHFLLRRLHSLSGVVPIGAFLILHLYSNYQAVGAGGEERFNKVVKDLQENPLIVFLEIFGVGLPILFHAFYGLVIAGQGRSNVRAYRYGANWRYTLQRLSGIVLVVFIAYHVWKTRLTPVFHPADFTASHGLVTYDYMHRYLSEGLLGLPVWIFYVLGVAATCFHFANGLWGFLIHWGITVGRRAQRVSLYACAGIGAVLFAMGLHTLYAFVTTS